MAPGLATNPPNLNLNSKLKLAPRSKALAVAVCLALRDCRDFGLRDQITRSAVSVPSNISEGAERPGRAEFRMFVGYALGGPTPGTRVMGSLMLI